MTDGATVHAIYSHRFDLPLDAVWHLREDFGNLGWVQGEGVGMVRTIHLPEVGVVQEELAFSRPGEHCYGYTVSGELPYPIADYRAQVSLAEDGDTGCRATWHGTFRPQGATPAESREVMLAVYRQIAGWIEVHLGA